MKSTLPTPLEQKVTKPTAVKSECCGAFIIEKENFHGVRKLRSDYYCAKCEKPIWKETPQKPSTDIMDHKDDAKIYTEFSKEKHTTDCQCCCHKPPHFCDRDTWDCEHCQTPQPLPNQEPVEASELLLFILNQNFGSYAGAYLNIDKCWKTLLELIAHQKALSRAEGAKEERERLFSSKELRKEWIDNFYESAWDAEDFDVTDFEKDLIDELTVFLPRHMDVYDWNLPYAHMIIFILRNLMLGNKLITDDKRLSDTLAVVEEIKNKEGV